jgi:uncharacterized membrane protein
MRRRTASVYSITFMAVMAALVYVVTLFRFPLLGSKVHFANAICLLSGLLLGPVQGGVAAGLGSALYDALAGGYDLVNVLITFVSKFLMAWVCGRIVRSAERLSLRRLLVAAAAGSLTYVAAYMLKTFVFQRFVYGYPLDATWATMVSKLIPSLINAAVSLVAAPVFYHGLLPALRKSGVLEKMNPGAL